MSNNETTTILETVPAGAEAYEMSASTPEVAFRLGQRTAVNLSRRGYETVCLGVIAHSALVDFREHEDREGMEAIAIRRDGYRPVLQTVGA